MAEGPHTEDKNADGPKTSDAKPASWWQTLPGLLTAVAAVVTAGTGLIVALHPPGAATAEKTHTGKPDAAKTEGSGSAPGAAGSRDAVGGSAPVTTSSQSIVTLPAGMEVKAQGGALSYKILAAHLEPFNTESRSLRFTVRMTNQGLYGTPLWSRSFRLLMDDVPSEPTNLLDELVDAGSAKEGDVEFTVPAAAGRVSLQVGDPGQPNTKIPFDLKAAGL